MCVCVCVCVCVCMCVCVCFSSSLLLSSLVHAHEKGIKFRVIVVDSRPMMEGTVHVCTGGRFGFIKPRCACAARAYGSRSVCVCVLFVTRISALPLRFG